MFAERKRKAAASMLVLLICDEEENKKKRGKTRKWIKRQEEKDYFCNIVREVRTEDLSVYREMMRMNYNQFLTMLRVLDSHISKKQVIGGHKTISAAERLTLTVRFLASGETFQSLCVQFRMDRVTISSIVREVCQAVAGPEYQCLYADVGTNGRVSDGGVWNNCGRLNSLENSLNFLIHIHSLLERTKLGSLMLPVTNIAFTINLIILGIVVQDGLWKPFWHLGQSMDGSPQTYGT